MARACSFVLTLLAFVFPGAAAAQSPTINFQPAPQATYVGARAIFTVIASGQALEFQWRRDGHDLVDGPGVGGATTDNLILSGVVLEDVGDYSVVVSNSFGSVTSVDAALTVRLPVAGDLDPLFDAGSSIDGDVQAVALQANGKVLIGGAFGTLNGAPRGSAARVNADGSTDHSFGSGLSGANNTVQAVVLQPDGGVLIGGSFTSVNATSRNRIARLEADGSLDTAFLNGLTGANNAVQAIAVQPDGNVLIGGLFTAVNGASRNRIARLNPNGAIDLGFLNGLTGANNPVQAIAVQPDGRILIAGTFTAVNGTSRNRIARLDASGTLDTGFLNGLAGANGEVLAVAVQPDGRVLIAGSFTSVNGVSRQRIARLDADGSLDTTFAATIDNAVHALAVQPDGRVLIGGEFSLVGGSNRQRIARLDAGGALDPTFLDGSVGSNGRVESIALQPDGRVLIGGLFTTVDGVSCSRLARLLADGSLDPTFVNAAAGVNGTVVETTVLGPDARVVIGGTFVASSGPETRSAIARLEASGNLDTAFLDADPFGGILTSVLQPDHRVLVGGSFTTIAGAERARIARLNADGSLDEAFLQFVPGANHAVRAIVLQPDGRVLIGGEFTTIGGSSRNRIARLEADGDLDTTFLNGLSGANHFVEAIALQPDGRILIGGSFAQVNGVARSRVARLESDGSVDATFATPTFNTGSVRSIVLQRDGRVLIGGTFTSIGGEVRWRIARLNPSGSVDTTFLNPVQGDFGASGAVEAIALQPDGRVLIGGDFAQVNGENRSGIARLESDGTVDPSFLDPLSGLGGVSGSVESLALQPDGRALIGGSFIVVNGEVATRVARLYTDPTVAPAIVEQPADQASYEGCCAVFHVEASGSPLDYRWRQDGVDLFDGDGLSGAASPTLTLTGLTAGDAGGYSVVVSNALGSATSDVATLSVSSVPECLAGSCDAELGCVLVDATEVCDGVDNDCDGGTDNVPLPGTTTVKWLPDAPRTLFWSAVPNATGYDVVRGSLATLRSTGGDFTSAIDECVENDLAATSIPLTGDPASATAFFFLVRGVNCSGNGSYDSGSPSQVGVRDAEIAASPQSCP